MESLKFKFYRTTQIDSCMVFIHMMMILNFTIYFAWKNTLWVAINATNKEWKNSTFFRRGDVDDVTGGAVSEHVLGDYSDEVEGDGCEGSQGGQTLRTGHDQLRGLPVPAGIWRKGKEMNQYPLRNTEVHRYTEVSLI